MHRGPRGAPGPPVSPPDRPLEPPLPPVACQPHGLTRPWPGRGAVAGWLGLARGGGRAAGHGCDGCASGWLAGVPWWVAGRGGWVASSGGGWWTGWLARLGALSQLITIGYLTSQVESVILASDARLRSPGPAPHIGAGAAPEGRRPAVARTGARKSEASSGGRSQHRLDRRPRLERVYGSGE